MLAQPVSIQPSRQPFTDALAKRWFQVVLLVMALGPFLNFITSLRTVAAAAGGPRGRFFRLVPLSAEDAFIAGGPPPKLGGTLMSVAKLQVLQGGGARGAWAAAEGAGNATLDRDHRGAAVIGLARPAAADGFVCPVERVKEGERPPFFRLETSYDGDRFEVAPIPPWTSIREEPRGVWGSEADGDGWVIWDLQPSWGWVLDFVGAQGVTAMFLCLAAGLGWAGHGRRGTLVVAAMCALRTAAYVTILGTDAWRTVIWGDAKSIAVFYFPRLAVYAPLTYIVALEVPGALDTFLISIATLNGVYCAERQLDGAAHGTVVSGMTGLVAALGAFAMLWRGVQLTMRLVQRE
jgi:hypothetical protein